MNEIHYLLSGSAFAGSTKKLYYFVFLFEPNLPERQICKGELGKENWEGYLLNELII